jgi:hypothetical protein
VKAFESETIGEVWEGVCKYLATTPDLPILDGSIGGTYVEATNVMLVARHCDKHPVISPSYRHTSLLDGFSGGEKSAEAQLLNTRLERWPGARRTVNQLDAIRATLKRNLFSRKGIATLWSPEDDPGDRNAICPVTFQVIARPDSGGYTSLNAMTVVRSSDAWVGLALDMWYFSRLQVKLANEFGLGLGSYTHVVASLHMYLYDLPLSSRL